MIYTDCTYQETNENVDSLVMAIASIQYFKGREIHSKNKDL